MALTKYEKHYREMIDINKDLFDELKLKSKSPKSEEFREIQLKAVRVARRSEDRLCSKMENTKNSNFSTVLADKFWSLIRADYPEIDL